MALGVKKLVLGLSHCCAVFFLWFGKINSSIALETSWYVFLALATKSPRSPNRGGPMLAQGAATRAIANRRGTLGGRPQGESAEPKAFSPSEENRGRNERPHHFGLGELRENGPRATRPIRSFVGVPRATQHIALLMLLRPGLK